MSSGDLECLGHEIEGRRDAEGEESLEWLTGVITSESGARVDER
jgi:hypothetical protein